MKAILFNSRRDSRNHKDPMKSVKPTYSQTDFDGFDYKETE